MICGKLSMSSFLRYHSAAACARLGTGTGRISAFIGTKLEGRGNVNVEGIEAKTLRTSAGREIDTVLSYQQCGTDSDLEFNLTT
jgi:hypothetical protein